MKCPYCNQEMEKGYIKSTHPIHWGKYTDQEWSPNDIRLNKFKWSELLRGCLVDTYYCSDCKKMIVSLE